MKAELSPWQAEKIGNLFDLFDADCDGSLDEQELLDCLERLRVDLGWPETSRVYSHVTARWKLFLRHLFKDSPVLTRKRWVSLVGRSLAGGSTAESLTSSLEEAAKLLVMLLDRDRDQRLKPEDFHHFFRALSSSEQEAEDAFERLDSTGDGALTELEMQVYLREYFCGKEPGSAGDHLFGVMGTTEP